MVAVSLPRGDDGPEGWWAKVLRMVRPETSLEVLPLSWQEIPGVSGRCCRERPESRRLQVFLLRCRSLESELPRRCQEVVPPIRQSWRDVRPSHLHWKIRSVGSHRPVANLSIAVGLLVHSVAFPAGEVLWVGVQLTALSLAVVQRVASRNRWSRGVTSQALKRPLCRGWNL